MYKSAGNPNQNSTVCHNNSANKKDQEIKWGRKWKHNNYLISVGYSKCYYNLDKKSCPFKLSNPILDSANLQRLTPSKFQFNDRVFFNVDVFQ
jgi:hypothetical protein